MDSRAFEQSVAAPTSPSEQRSINQPTADQSRSQQSARALRLTIGRAWVPCPKTGQLTVQEIRVLELISRGLSNKMIARSLQIAPETVKSHVKHILAKLNADTRAAAVWRAKGLSPI